MSRVISFYAEDIMVSYPENDRLITDLFSKTLFLEIEGNRIAYYIRWKDKIETVIQGRIIAEHTERYTKTDLEVEPIQDPRLKSKIEGAFKDYSPVSFL